MNDQILVAAIAWVAVMGGIGMGIGNHRNRLIAGLVWGVLLGVLGWLLVWIGPTAPSTSRRRAKRPGNW